jgi:hypothetical protein
VVLQAVLEHQDKVIQVALTAVLVVLVAVKVVLVIQEQVDKLLVVLVKHHLYQEVL